MKQQYNNMEVMYGPYEGGICSLHVAPREWFSTPIVSEFLTGTVTTPVEFVFGKNWLKFTFVPETYIFDEKPKQGKPGDYFEITAQGTLNNLNTELRQYLESLRYHEMICLLKDREGRMRIVGNADNGMTLKFSNKQTNAQGGLQILEVDLMIESETTSPYYDI